MFFSNGLPGCEKAISSGHVIRRASIGTGIIPKSNDLKKTIVFLRKNLLKKFGLKNPKILYGGSVNPKNVRSFKELNIVLKGDVDGSIEALSDSMEKLSTDEISVNIIHRGVGQITESDVLLASASDAIIIGFQVRPSLQARKLAEIEQIDIRLYSIIYKAIN